VVNAVTWSLSLERRTRDSAAARADGVSQCDVAGVAISCLSMCWSSVEDDHELLYAPQRCHSCASIDVTR
jgi:hypothetical protein